MSFKPRRLHLLTLFLLCCTCFRLTGQADRQSLFDYLQTYDSIHILIKTDFRALLKKKDKYQPATLTITSGDELVMAYEGEIRTRGNARKSICFMPPTKLRFAKDDLREMGLSEYPTLKVVNTCALSERDETYVQTEHLMYQLNAAVTDKCFRTLLVHLAYEDTMGKRKPVAFAGFLIEHEDQMASRLQGRVYNPPFFKKELLDRDTYVNFAMFQYMIGNTDWKILNKHNLRVVAVASQKKVYPIAYDFDYAGLVSTHYAVPHDKLPIEHVKERLYLGPCQTDEEVERHRLHFLGCRETITQLVMESALPEKRKANVSRYLDQFFKVLDDPRRAAVVFSDCIDY